MNAMDLKDRVAIVTGASAGIGAAIVKALLKIGMKVVGFARRKERIEALGKGYDGKLFAQCVDVTKPEEIVAGFKWVTTNVGPVHVLINNAGIGSSSSILEGDLETWKNIIDTNFMGVAVACKEAVKIMKEHKIDGYIININSIAGYYCLMMPNIVMYRTSKESLKIMTEHIRMELARSDSKIRITTLAPGLVKTEIMEASGNTKQESEAMYENFPYLLSEDIADTVIYLLSTPQRVHITEMLVRPTGEDLKKLLVSS